ncbi:MAG: TIGR02757 family protein [Desulfosalsimonadaceae bacterium]
MSKPLQQPPDDLHDRLEACYRLYNRRRYVHPDPLEFLYSYQRPEDREIAGLIAASLAYGRVGQILKSVSVVLSRMGPSPRAYLEGCGPERLRRDMEGFVHRFAGEHQMAALLWAVREVLLGYGSLEQCFRMHLEECGNSMHPALCRFSADLRRAGQWGGPGHLVACPEKGSACKRIHLFLRWMVRKDRVDPGGWEGVSPALLIVPLDTHMFRMCKSLGLTVRRQADMKAAAEITGAFRQFSPRDPVKYDFVLTRFGIRKDLSGSEAQIFA